MKRVKQRVVAMTCGGVCAAFLAVALFVCAEPAHALDVSFGQRIMPVRFVYLDRHREIASIFDTVSERDPSYIVRFFGSDRNPISVGDIAEPLWDLYIRDRMNGSVSYLPGQVEHRLEFVRRGETIEEIHTYV